MRRIGTLQDSTQARHFCDYLVTLSIDAAVDSDGEGQDACWDIWIRDEKDVERARQAFTQFKESPKDSKFQVGAEASRIRDERVADQQRRESIQREAQRSMPRQSSPLGSEIDAPVKQRGIPVTIAIIAISVVVSFTSHFGDPRGSRVPGKTTLEEKTYYGLSFVDWREYRKDGDPFASIRQGQVWRLVTPMFLHGDEFHLAFNMLWIFFLGSAIERLHGSLFFGLLTMGTQIAGMMLQVMLPGSEVLADFFQGTPFEFLSETLSGSPFAIGASGAVYGLFGFLWIRPMVDRSYPIHLVPMNVILMLGWLVACMTPLVENVANGAHLGGLLAGVAVGYFGYFIRR
jgi:GlpG protein